ncbi:hypothetical protein JWG41_09370 [Leptospira sp. 201903075]|uniref:hypothetical protein n=1 Tax=Leptospira chreensis TaxID=2810035 RepID=UPI00196531C4|nr:hypothetical protein [Leptospira chreensis]MBM9590651.1 hypothetical protein [Leptospira chreensis]
MDDLFKFLFSRGLALGLYYTSYIIMLYLRLYYSHGIDLFDFTDKKDRRILLGQLPEQINNAILTTEIYLFILLIILPYIFLKIVKYISHRIGLKKFKERYTTNENTNEQKYIDILLEIDNDPKLNFLYWFPANETLSTEIMINPKREQSYKYNHGYIFQNPRIQKCLSLKILKYDNPNGIFRPGNSLIVSKDIYFTLENKITDELINKYKGRKFQTYFTN